MSEEKKTKAEAWYRCAVHGWQYHRAGPDLLHPCQKCALESPRAMQLGEWEWESEGSDG